MKSLRNLVFVAMLVMLMITACNPFSPVPNVVAKFADVSYTEILEVNKMYQDAYPKETKYSAASAEQWLKMDQYWGTMKDMNFMVDKCWVNVKNVLMDATIGLHDVPNAGAVGDGSVIDRNKLVSALVVNDLYPANAKQCDAALNATIAEIPKGREAIFQVMKDAVEQRASLKNLYDGTIKKAAFRRMLNLYGKEFIAYANEQLAKTGIAPFPDDFVGFPTSGVTANTKSKEWCNYYISIAKGEREGDPQYAKSMYQARWVGPDNGGECQMSQASAWEFNGRLILSRTTSNAQGCGEALPALGETIDEKCKTTKDGGPGSFPTATPKPK